MNTYVKLQDIEKLTVESYVGCKWKMYDSPTGKWRQSDKPEPGFKKVYGIQSPQGTLEIKQKDFQKLLEAAFEDGISDITGKTFKVFKQQKTSNFGGKDVTYYNFEFERFVGEEEVDVSSIPF